jgi:hypothetical protein
MTHGKGRRSRTRLVAAALLVSTSSLASCSDGGSGDGIPDGGYTDTDCAQTLDGSDEPIFDQANSRFALTGDATYMELSGAIYDGPAVAFHHESDRVGACRLLTYDATSCDPACTGGDVCVDSECVSYPSAVSAGTLRLTGVPGAPVEVEPWIGQYT